MSAAQIRWISSDDPADKFPPIDSAATEPDGLLAAGGDLSPERLLTAYERGIFPWYDEGQPILWWSPDPRCVLDPAAFHVSRSLRRTVRKSQLEIAFNTAFPEVVAACADRREGQSGTWITADMTRAYEQLRQLGWAHSVEVWSNGDLAGGLYGIAIGRVFFAESMFSRRTDASKVALMSLSRLLVLNEFPLIDCQVSSPHLHSLGARSVRRADFATTLQRSCQPRTRATFWPARCIPATNFLDGGAIALQ